ncbi:MAG: glycoside hydrolase family 2 sugar binding protein, partial [Akkermansiaceae bacterium]|nr:glycoside hydrolase family 2 sugar binding protein [Akkermansiaceae bacterium]
CLESKLCGVQRLLQPYEALWYRRPLDLAPVAGQRTMLNFEAVDYRTKVWVNGQEVGTHTGGNLPFSFDITDALKPSGNELVMRVEDDTEAYQQNGKQRIKAEGIFYTRVSGIWQTVWTEQVAPRHITNLAITTDIATGGISIKPTLAGAESAGETLEAQALDGGKVVAEAKGTLDLKVPNAKLWSPKSPSLYDLKIVLKDASGKIIDEVASYTGIRKVGQVRDKDGNLRFTLNDKPIFHWGPLDQGWWPDGLLTPPSEEAIAFEIKFLKDSGFNMIRKHIKVEPRVYYQECDKLGMLVWQDQVSGGPSPAWTRSEPNPKDAQWPDENHKEWMAELDGMITLLDPFPSIVVWTPFNEAWGQHRTMEVGEWAVKRDPSRLINIASGGNFWPVGNISDQHVYPDPDFDFADTRFKDLIKVVGEFGGHGWAVEGHIWDPKKGNWGYGGLPKDIGEYKKRYDTSIEKLINLKAKGVAAGVYTQTTDVEGEINGLMTYDRKVVKIKPEDLKKVSAPLLED